VLAGNLVHITYCLLGIGLIIAKSILAFAALKYAAAAYLIYLGIQSLRAGNQRWRWATSTVMSATGTGSCRDSSATSSIRRARCFISGVHRRHRSGHIRGAMLVLVCSMMLVSAAFWLLFVSTLDRPAIRRWIARSQRTVNRVSGGLMILLGIEWRSPSDRSRMPHMKRWPLGYASLAGSVAAWAILALALVSGGLDPRAALAPLLRFATTSALVVSLLALVLGIFTVLRGIRGAGGVGYRMFVALPADVQRAWVDVSPVTILRQDTRCDCRTPL
jgi:threonine/homoserine/homoserine lactone efflux protein